MITRLTRTQWAQLEADGLRWRGIARCTQHLDRTAATAAFAALYALIEEPPPAVLFLSSPVSCVIAAGALALLANVQSPTCEPLQLVHPRSGEVVPGQVAESLEGEMGEFFGVQGELMVHCEAEVDESLLTAVHGALRAAIGHIPEDIWFPAHEHLTEICGLRHSVREIREPCRSLRESVVRQVRAELLPQVSHRIRDELDRASFQSPPGALWSLAREHWMRHPFLAGRGWGEEAVFHDVCRRIGVVYPHRELQIVDAQLRHSEQCPWWYGYEGFVLASERPAVLNVDSDGRLHHESAPALVYRDGLALHLWHGVSVPAQIIERPLDITVASIEAESNAEVRRVMLERFGWARYIQKCGANVVDKLPEDHPIAGLRGARLLRKQLPGEPEPIVYLEMVNTTPEPDGSHKRYLERIDPKAYNGAAGRLCQAAMASRWRYRDDTGQLRLTFNRWQDYRPTQES